MRTFNGDFDIEFLLQTWQAEMKRGVWTNGRYLGPPMTRTLLLKMIEWEVVYGGLWR